MFDPEDFAKLAVRLVQNPCGAADSRTAVSRAYYAAFLYAKTLLDPHFYFSAEGKVHTEIRFLFVNSTRGELRTIGQQLDDLRAKRNAADYDLAAADVNSYHNARIHVAVSARVIEKLKQVFSNVDTDKRYVQKYGANQTDDFKRKVVGDGWIDRYKAMFDGMRAGMDNAAWKKNVRFLAYNAFGPDNFGNGDGWKKYSTTTDDRITWTWQAWDGAIPEAYDNAWQPGKTAFNLWSCQTEKFNSVFMKEECLKANPNFWLEIVFWDGHSTPKKDAVETEAKDKYKQYEKLGVPYTPEVYRGWVQYVMWTVQPRVAREWRGSGDHPRDNWWPYFSEIMRAVDLVHADPVLTAFWRKGELVPNRAHKHPFHSDIPEKWKEADRWFALDTSVDPPRPWDLKTRLPVMALARVMGDKPHREWLLYAHAPMGDKKDVEIAIPDYRKVNVSVSVGGSFHHLKEIDGSVTPVGNIDQAPAAPVEMPALSQK